MINRKLLILLATLNIINFCNGYYGWGWYKTVRMTYKLLSCEKNLVQDGMRNALRVNHLKEYYSFSPNYDVGQMMYFIRSKYARMIRVYIIIHDKHAKLNYASEYLESLTEIQRLASDIYNLIEMMEEYELTSGTRTTNLFRFMPKVNINDTFRNMTPGYPSRHANLRKRIMTPKYKERKENHYEGINFDSEE